MKNILLPTAFLMVTILITGCTDTSQRADENLDRLHRKALALDSLIGVEYRKLNILDSAITDEFTKTGKLDSMVNKESRRIDSLLNKLYERIEQDKKK
jgi:archaellum component FlaC